MHRKILQLNDFVFKSGGLLTSTGDDFGQDVDKICADIKIAGLVDITTALEYRIFNVISFLSIFACIIVFLTSYWNEKLL